MGWRVEAMGVEEGYRSREEVRTEDGGGGGSVCVRVCGDVDVRVEKLS